MKIAEKANNTGQINPFISPGLERVIPITQSQGEIWTACKFGGDDANRAYNDSVTVSIEGPLNTVALKSAMNKLVARHESLRAIFSQDGRFMCVFEQGKLPLQYRDISALNGSEKKKALTDYLSKERCFVFDLTRGPLLKVGLLKSSATGYNLIVTAHHIICDGWSIGVFLEELGSLYGIELAPNSSELPEPERFSTYADEQKSFETSKEFGVTENFWVHQFKSKVPQVTIPIDFPRPPIRTFKSERQDFILRQELVLALKKIGAENGCSLVTTLLTTFEIFLFQQTGQKDLVVGLPTAGQALSGQTQLIGHCVNLLPLRSHISHELSFLDYLKKRKSELFDAYEHQNLSFGQLLQKLSFARDPARVPLVPIVFNVDIGLSSEVNFEGLSIKVHNNPRAYEAFELFLNVGGTEEEVILEWSYNTQLFTPSSIKLMMGSLEDIIKKIVNGPHLTLGKIAYQEHPIYNTLNNTSIAYPDKNLTELIRRQAEKTPNKLAIQFNDICLTYKELENSTNRLAHQLIALGIQKGDFVGVALPRSERLVVVLLAIIKCGAAYLPLDPLYPSQRLDYMLEDSGAKLLITAKTFSTKFGERSKIALVEDLFLDISSYSMDSLNWSPTTSNVAYILYTSGSTGRPKGVTVTHKNLINFLYSMGLKPGIKTSDRLLSITTISFDIAGLELFLPLINGATLLLTNDEVSKDGRLLFEFIKSKAISMLQATPSTWQMLLDVGWEQKLPIKALSGGEALPMSLAKILLTKVDELWNMYGPTETTIWSAVKKIEERDTTISVGNPIANTQIYLLNDVGLPVAPGVVGEIAIAGHGVANGYWNRPKLTKEKFIWNPFIQKTVYRTGDLGKILPNSEIQCLGRKDQQVKIRGHRIELEEIEQSLETIASVHKAVVLEKEGHLWAYLALTKDEKADSAKMAIWKDEIQKQLPNHMIPKQYVVIPKFPTTLNGKIDRKALLSQPIQDVKKEKVPRELNTTENLIIKIWKQCLDIPKIQPHDNFFELGGHSLIAVKVMTLLEKGTGIRLPLATLLEYPTITKLAARLEEEHSTTPFNCLVPLAPHGNKTPLFLVHGANYNVLVFKELAKSLDDEQPVYGLQAKGIDGSVAPDDTIEAMAAHFIAEIEMIYPEGPYSLAGFSFGGIIAFEMYKQLRAKGKQVKVLASLDSYVYPNYYYKNATIKILVYRLYMIGQIGFVFLNMFSNKKNFNRRVRLLKIMFNGFYLRLKHGREKQMELQFHRASEIDEKHGLAFYKYTIEPEDVKINLFRASENVYFAHDFKFLGWKKIALKGIRKHSIPGNHNDMFESPNVAYFAKVFQHTLDNFDATND
ncbi:MAG: amino acid adenylation domain-containing protein [Bacteroidota bacterium]